MPDELTLTAAEVSYLLSATDPDGRSSARAALQISAADGDARLLAAGQSSLAVRDLLSADDATIKLGNSASAVAYGMGRANTCVEMGLVSETQSDAAILFDADGGRLLVTPQAMRCFRITGLAPGIPLYEPISSLTLDFLASHRPGVVSMRVTRAGADASWLLLVARADGRWSTSTVADISSELPALTEPEAVDAWKRELKAVLDDPAG